MRWTSTVPLMSPLQMELVVECCLTRRTFLNTTVQPSPPNNPNGTPDVAFADPPAVGTYTVQIADVTGFSELFLQATRDITAANPVTMGAGNSIRLEANNNISVNAGANVTASGVGSIQLRADADSSGTGAVALNAPLVARRVALKSQALVSRVSPPAPSPQPERSTKTRGT